MCVSSTNKKQPFNLRTVWEGELIFQEAWTVSACSWKDGGKGIDQDIECDLGQTYQGRVTCDQGEFDLFVIDKKAEDGRVWTVWDHYW